MEKKFLNLINQDDDLQIAIRCHLIMEFYLIKIIEIKLPNPEGFDIDRVSFKQKVELAIALEGIEKDKKGLFLYINKLRNKYAHDIDTQITGKEIEDMYALLDKDDKESLSNTAYEEMKTANKLGGIYLILYVYLSTKYEFFEKSSI